MEYKPGDILISYGGYYYLVVAKPQKACLLLVSLDEGDGISEFPTSLDPDIASVISMFRSI